MEYFGNKNVIEVIKTLKSYMSNQSSNGITNILTYDLLKIVNKLRLAANEAPKAIVIEECNSNDFANILNSYLETGYKIESSSCNSKTWKTILIKDVDKDHKDE